mmetsp:Transcript_11621/g.38209  ORF Transcript_11621/g.38209 Transcript_11621/m.38209 type:complete len:221 (+) Transcript_11621:41-703(+)
MLSLLFKEHQADDGREGSVIKSQPRKRCPSGAGSVPMMEPVVVSTKKARLGVATTRRLASGEKEMPLALLSRIGSRIVRRRDRVRASQMWIVVVLKGSAAIWWQPVESARSQKPSSPASGNSMSKSLRPVSHEETRTNASRPHEESRVESGETRRRDVKVACPSKEKRCEPLSTSHTPTGALSSPPAASIFEFGESARANTGFLSGLSNAVSTRSPVVAS